MSKFKVRITRVETYSCDVEVEAESIEDAIAQAEDNEQNNEYDELFDCPDDVSTSFKDADDPTYGLEDLINVDIDSWVAAIAAMSDIETVRKEAFALAGVADDGTMCPAELEREYTALANRYRFRFDEKGRIVSYDLTKKGTGEE